MTTARKLYLYGDLADRYGAEHDVVCGTIGEAVRIVDCNHPGFCRSIRKRGFHVGIGGRDLETEVTEVLPHQLPVPRANGDFHLVPALEGGKSRTFKTIFSIVIGGALLATGIGGALAASSGTMLGGTGFSLALGASTGFLGLSYGTVALMGAAFFLGGINMLLTPTPKTSTGEKKPTSFAFSGPDEVDDEGGPIPIIIGEVITGPVKIASAVESTVSGSLTGYQDGTFLGFGVGGAFDNLMTRLA